MKKIIILTLLISIVNACKLDNDKSLEHYSNALKYCDNDQYTKALEEIELAYSLDSTNYDMQLLKAKIKFELDFYNDAIEILENNFPENYKIDTINFLLGEYYFELGSYYSYKEKNSSKEIDAYSNSIKYLDQAIRCNPMYFSAYIIKHSAEHNLERYNKSLITLNQAINRFPNDMKLVYRRGIEKYYLGDQMQAFTDLDSAINCQLLDSSDLSTAFRFRGIIFYRIDSIKKAIKDLDNSIMLNPQNDLAYGTLGDIYRFIGDLEAACSNYRKSAELGNVVVYEDIKEFCINQ